MRQETAENNPVRHDSATTEELREQLRLKAEQNRKDLGITPFWMCLEGVAAIPLGIVWLAHEAWLALRRGRR